MDTTSFLLGVLVVFIFVCISELFYILVLRKSNNDQFIKEVEWKAKDDTEKLSDDQLKSSVDKFLNK